MNYCPNCGTTVRPVDRFCRDCGAPLDAQQAILSVRRTPCTDEWGLLLVLVLLLAAAIGVLIEGFARDGRTWPWPCSRLTETSRERPFGFGPRINTAAI